MEPPGVFGIDAAFKRLEKFLATLLGHQHQEFLAAIGCIERTTKQMADQVQDLRDAVEALTNEVSEVAGDIVDALDRLNAKIGNQPDLASDIQSIRGAIGKLQDSDALLDAAGVDVPPGPSPSPGPPKPGPAPEPGRGRK